MAAKSGNGKERIYRVGLADPRTGPERIAGLVNRAVTVGRKAPVRSYDDSPSVMARKKAATRKK